MLGRPLSLPPSVYRQLYLTNYAAEEANKMAKCFSCPGDCKELSKKTTHDSNQAGTKPWPTSDNSAITKRIGTSDTPKCLSNLGDCGGLSEEARRLNSRNQGSSQLTVW